MRYLRYERLNDITKTVSPYRGSTNRFPIGSRTQNNKYFLVEELDGERVFKIIYGSSWGSNPISFEEYTQAKLNKDPDVYDQPIYDAGYNVVGKSYARYYRRPNVMGIVRADNTFEFTKKQERGYGQGEKQILTSWSAGWVYSSSRQGGMVYRSGQEFHPIWEGMRVDCDTFKPTKDYKVIGKKVSRKDANTLLAGYKDFYKCADVMLQAMDTKTIVGLGAELLDEIKLDADIYGTWSLDVKGQIAMLDEARKRMSTTPLDSAVLYCIAFNFDSMWRRVQNHIDPTKYNYYGTNSEIDTQSLFSRMQRKINKDLYAKNKSVMMQREFAPGEIYPPSEWGVEILVDGEVVEQYC